MASLILENLDQTTIDALKSRADEHGLSVEQYLTAALASEQAPDQQPPDRQAIAKQLAAIRQRTVPAKFTMDEATDYLRDMRASQGDTLAEKAEGRASS